MHITSDLYFKILNFAYLDSVRYNIAFLLVKMYYSNKIQQIYFKLINL